MGEDKTQPLISLWINCQACPRGAVVWGSGADKQCLSPPGDTHDSSGVFERSGQAHGEMRVFLRGTDISLQLTLETQCSLVWSAP